MVKSWVFGGNDPEIGRGLNHLPFTAFVDEETGARRIGVGIGACVLDLALAAEALPDRVRAAVRSPRLNELMGLGEEAWAELRTSLQFLLGHENSDRRVLEAALLPVRGLSLELPAEVGDYTDFYASRNHARRVGELFRPEKPLLDNYDWVPIAYHGRASSLVASGAEVRRPWGQRSGEEGPIFAPTAKLDYELELGFYIGRGNQLGVPIPVGGAEARVFGVSLLNDWSARDVQAWEYQPLGPFLGKNFCTSVSPWVTPLAALEGMRSGTVPHDGGTLEYLAEVGGRGFAIDLEVQISTAKSKGEGFVLSEGNADGLYWTLAQMIAHHTVGGCNLRPGDLLGTGTVSGVDRAQAGCLLELTRNGADTITLPNGETRTFLVDGDEIVFSGIARATGQMPVRLGECRGRIEAALILAKR